MNQSLIQGPQETAVDHRGGKASFLKQGGCVQSRVHHRAIGHDQQIIPFPQQLTATDRECFPALLHQRHADP